MTVSEEVLKDALRKGEQLNPIFPTHKLSQKHDLTKPLIFRVVQDSDIYPTEFAIAVTNARTDLTANGLRYETREDSGVVTLGLSTVREPGVPIGNGNMDSNIPYAEIDGPMGSMYAVLARLLAGPHSTRAAWSDPDITINREWSSAIYKYLTDRDRLVEEYTAKMRTRYGLSSISGLPLYSFVATMEQYYHAYIHFGGVKVFIEDQED